MWGVSPAWRRKPLTRGGAGLHPPEDLSPDTCLPIPEEPGSSLTLQVPALCCAVELEWLGHLRPFYSAILLFALLLSSCLLSFPLALQRSRDEAKLGLTFGYGGGGFPPLPGGRGAGLALAGGLSWLSQDWAVPVSIDVLQASTL